MVVASGFDPEGLGSIPSISSNYAGVVELVDTLALEASAVKSV